jgi:hypothetical protein
MAAAVAVAVGEALTVKLLEFVWLRAALRVPCSILVRSSSRFFFFFATMQSQEACVGESPRLPLDQLRS